MERTHKFLFGELGVTVNDMFLTILYTHIDEEVG